MKKLLVTMGFAAACCFSTLSAQEISTITLKDQTVIRGEVIGMNKGIYSIKSGSLGVIEIPAKQVISIVVEGQTGSPADASQTPTTRLKNTAVVIREGHAKKSQGVPPATRSAPVNDATDQAPMPDERLQKDASGRVQSMMMNEDFSQKVMGMSESSEMEDVLNDPETMEAIRNNDYQSLMNNDKMKKLMESSGMRDILGDFEE